MTLSLQKIDFFNDKRAEDVKAYTFEANCLILVEFVARIAGARPTGSAGSR